MNSLSKGIFVFKNGMSQKSVKRNSSKLQIGKSSFDFGNSVDLWDKVFEKTWETIQQQVDAFQTSNNNDNLAEILEFIDKSYADDDVNSDSVHLPVAALLTGINKPDHHQYFKSLSDKIASQKISFATVLPARDCPNIKSTVETLVSCILSKGRKHNYHEEADDPVNTSIQNEDSDESDDEVINAESDTDEPPIKLRRSQYTLNVLQAWYSHRISNETNGTKPKITIIIPNFEEFKPAVIKSLVSILSNHCHKLPFILILGVATTTTTIFHTLSFAETTRIKLHAFSSQSPVINLNHILEDIILTPRSSFHLSGKVFEYFVGVFLYYDLTVKEFLKSFRYCLLEHYSKGNAFAICSTTYAESIKTIDQMTHVDIEMIRRLPSFRPYVESLTNYADVIAIFSDDEYFRSTLKPLVRNIFSYFLKFHCFVRVLLILVKDLPQAPLGKNLRDIYSNSFSANQNVIDSEEFSKCWQYLEYISKQEIVILLDKCCEMMNNYAATYCSDNDKNVDKYVAMDARNCIEMEIEQLTAFKLDLLNVGQSMDDKKNRQSLSKKSNELKNVDSRQMLQQRLLEMAQQTRTETNQELRKLLDYLKDKIFGKHLISFNRGPPLIELFVFSDITAIRAHLKGAPRGAIHRALTNPQYYIQCDCCIIDEDYSQLRPTMPDIAIAYKLLLESGQQVNIFDWLQAFRSIVETDENDEVSPLIQAKFTRARAELQFLGFIKSSKRKTDHVTRTTW